MGVVIFGLLLGVLVGILLEKGSILEPKIVIKQLLLQDFTLLKTALIAIAVSSFVFSLLNYVELMEVKAFSFNLLDVIFGGLLIGVSIALTGTLPISIPAQIGVGYIEAIAILIGGIVGCMLYHAIYYFLDIFIVIPTVDIDAVHFKLDYPFYIIGPIFATLLIIVVICLYKIEQRREENNLLK